MLDKGRMGCRDAVGSNGNPPFLPPPLSRPAADLGRAHATISSCDRAGFRGVWLQRQACEYISKDISFFHFLLSPNIVSQPDRKGIARANSVLRQGYVTGILQI